MNLAEIKIQCATIRLIAPHIIENIIHDYVTLEKKNILEIKRINMQLSEGQPYAVLVDGGTYTAISKEARELSASKEFAQETIAKALLLRYIGQRIVAQFYININKPHVKTKLFTDREKAIEWLNAQIKKTK